MVSLDGAVAWDACVISGSNEPSSGLVKWHLDGSGGRNSRRPERKRRVFVLRSANLHRGRQCLTLRYTAPFAESWPSVTWRYYSPLGMIRTALLFCVICCTSWRGIFGGRPRSGRFPSVVQTPTRKRLTPRGGPRGTSTTTSRCAQQNAFCRVSPTCGCRRRSNSDSDSNNCSFQKESRSTVNALFEPP